MLVVGLSCFAVTVLVLMVNCFVSGKGFLCPKLFSGVECFFREIFNTVTYPI
jgi:hypothetical protein